MILLILSVFFSLNFGSASARAAAAPVDVDQAPITGCVLLLPTFNFVCVTEGNVPVLNEVLRPPGASLSERRLNAISRIEELGLRLIDERTAPDGSDALTFAPELDH